jgi:tetratricopeptide (TPR) repeat protein/DNA-binding winged helix-turn-helix (wHTH) protein
MNPSPGQIYRIADVEVDALSGRLRRDGEECRLREQSLQVLLYLIERRERPVTKEELMETVWRGTAVTDDALVQCIVEIRKALGDDPRRSRFIKTIPKIGYRFIGPVEGHEERGLVANGTEEVTSFRVEYEEELSDQEVLIKRTPDKPLPLPGAVIARQRRTALAATVALILLAAIALPIYLHQKTLADRQELAELTLPQVGGKRPVAVMYFENRSGTPELDWLREGLADMLITDLSRSAKLAVLNRRQLHRLLERAGHRQGEVIQPTQALAIARSSQAESVILGSFARLGEKLRLDVQLYDARSGQLAAAESLTVDRAEQILTQVDLLALKLATRLGAAPTEQEQRAGLADVMTDNLEAYRCYSLGLEKTYGLQNEEAIALFERAVALDPQFSMAYGRIGYAHAVRGDYAEKAKPYLEKAFQLSNRLAERDSLYIKAWYSIANLDYSRAIESFRKIIAQYPMEVEAYVTLGYLLRGEGHHEEAVSVLKQSLVIDQEAREVYNALGLIYLDLHRYDEAIAAHQRYVQLAPAEPNAYDSLGISYQCAGRYAEALAAYGQAIALKPDHFVANIHLGNTYIQLGRYEAALAQFRRLIQIAPDDLTRSRAYGSIAETYLRKRDLRQAAAAARMEQRFEKYNLWNSVVLALEQGDMSGVNELESRLFADWPYTVRGQRFPARLISYRRGYLALKREQSAKSIEHFKEALRHPPIIWMIDPLEDCLAKAYLEVGQPDEAIKEYDRILRLNPNYPLAHYHLGQAYERQGQQQQARASYERFLKVWKNADAEVPEIIYARRALSRAP